MYTVAMKRERGNRATESRIETANTWQQMKATGEREVCVRQE